MIWVGRVVWGASWFGFNLAVNLYNAWLLGSTNFDFPCLLTTTNKLIGLVASLLILLLSHICSSSLLSPAALVPQLQRPLVHALGIIAALHFSFNNWSLIYVSVTINQIIASVAPLPTMILSQMLEQRSFSWQVVASMLVVIVGAAYAAWGDGAATFAGAALSCTSVLTGALWVVLSAMLMQSGERPLDAVSLLVVSSPASIVVAFSLFLIFERPAFLVWLSEPPPSAGLVPAGVADEPFHADLFLVAGLLAFLYDVAHNQFIALTSSVTMAIMANAKLVVLVGVSMVLFPTTASPHNLLGAAVGLGGAVWYTVHRICDEGNAREGRRRDDGTAGAAGAAAAGEDDGLGATASAGGIAGSDGKGRCDAVALETSRLLQPSPRQTPGGSAGRDG